MCLKGQCDGYLSQDPCYPRRTVRSKVITCILVHRVWDLDLSLPCRKASIQITREEKEKIFLQLELPACRKASMQITREEKGKIFLQLELPACRKASMQITLEENCLRGVWIGVALTFGRQLGLAKIDHPPLHRLARHIHSRVSCKGTGWGKIIFYRIFIAICAQASATARPSARWIRLASLRRGYAKPIT